MIDAKTLYQTKKTDLTKSTFHDDSTELTNRKKYIFSHEKPYSINSSNNLKIDIVTNERDLKNFFQVSWIVYKNDKYWIPPIWLEIKEFFRMKNPFWKHANARLFIIYMNNEIVGRIAAIIDYKYCQTYGKKIGYFGFFECIKDINCAETLLQNAQNWLASKGMEVMRGPINGRIDVGCGFLYSGFKSPPSLLSPYSPAYYISFIEKFNMKKTRDLILYRIDLTKPIPKKLEKKAKQCNETGVKIRKFKRLNKNKELKWWIELFLESFEDHWGYVPVSTDEVLSRFGIKQLRWFVDPRLFLIAEFNDSPVAFLWSTPDYNQIFQKMNGKLNFIQILKFLWNKNNINTGKLHFIGIKKEFRNKNIGSYLNYKTLVEMKNRGYNEAEVVIDEGNTIAHKTISITGAKQYKKFRVFEKKFHSK